MVGKDGSNTVFFAWLDHVCIQLHSLPNDKNLDHFKLIVFADDKINVTPKKNEICEGKGRKHCGKKRKCWLPAFFFLTRFSKGSGLCGKELR